MSTEMGDRQAAGEIISEERASNDVARTAHYLVADGTVVGWWGASDEAEHDIESLKLFVMLLRAQEEAAQGGPGGQA